MQTPERLVLDTHVWIWMADGVTDDLSDHTVRAINAVARRGELLISAISFWEVAMLESKGRLTLSRPLDAWVQEAARAPGLRVAEFSAEIAVASTRLPGERHRDPSDRIIIATARSMDATLVTADRDILRYAAGGHLHVLPAGG